MITLEQIAAVLKNSGREECVSNVVIDSLRGTVFSQLESRIHSEQPYRLTVTPDENLQELRILVLSFLELSKDSALLHRLFQLNVALDCGSLCINPSNRKLYFHIRHLCEDHNGPTPEFLENTLTKCVKNVRVVEQVLLFGIMLEAGLSEGKAEQLVKNVFGDHFITNWNHLMKTKKQIARKQLGG